MTKEFKDEVLREVQEANDELVKEEFVTKEFNLSKNLWIDEDGIKHATEDEIKEFIKIILECKCPICKQEEPCKHCSQVEDLNNKKWIKKIKKRAGDKLC